ncbi:unnamed protein product, partial [Prorocentrum cordatum]
DPAAGEMFQRTASMRRALALSKTQPLAATINPSMRNVLQDRVLDDRGRAISDGQSDFALSLSLAVSGGALAVGIFTGKVDSSTFALWLAPRGSNWTGAETKAARQVFFDLVELDSARVFPVAADKDWAAAAAVAASGAPEERSKTERRIQRERRNAVDLEDADSTVPDNKEDSESTDCASSEVHVRDVAWPGGSRMRLCSSRMASERRRRLSELIARLEGQCCPAPLPSEFLTGIPRASDGGKSQGQLFPVLRAFASTEMHFLGVLKREFDGEGFDRNRFFCRAIPSLQPASGGDHRVECAGRERPIWAVLLHAWGVQAAPDFLMRSVKGRDGGARLVEEGDGVPLEEDVRHPAFWRFQFARTDALRRWLYWKGPDEWLTMEEVDWVLNQRGGQTLLIRRVVAASGAPKFEIGSGTVVTLAEMFYHGWPFCIAFDIYKLYMDLPIFIHKH